MDRSQYIQFQIYSSKEIRNMIIEIDSSTSLNDILQFFQDEEIIFSKVSDIFFIVNDQACDKKQFADLVKDQTTIIIMKVLDGDEGLLKYNQIWRAHNQSAYFRVNIKNDLREITGNVLLRVDFTTQLKDLLEILFDRGLIKSRAFHFVMGGKPLIQLDFSQIQSYTLDCQPIFERFFQFLNTAILQAYGQKTNATKLRFQLMYTGGTAHLDIPYTFNLKKLESLFILCHSQVTEPIFVQEGNHYPINSFDPKDWLEDKCLLVFSCKAEWLEWFRGCLPESEISFYTNQSPILSKSQRIKIVYKLVKCQPVARDEKQNIQQH